MSVSFLTALYQHNTLSKWCIYSFFFLKKMMHFTIFFELNFATDLVASKSNFPFTSRHLNFAEKPRHETLIIYTKPCSPQAPPQVRRLACRMHWSDLRRDLTTSVHPRLHTGRRCCSMRPTLAARSDPYSTWCIGATRDNQETALLITSRAVPAARELQACGVSYMP